MLTRRTPHVRIGTPHIHSAYFILGWVAHILDGGIEDIGFGGEFMMQFFFVSVKTGRKVANLPQT